MLKLSGGGVVPEPDHPEVGGTAASGGTAQSTAFGGPWAGDEGVPRHPNFLTAAVLNWISAAEVNTHGRARPWQGRTRAPAGAREKMRGKYEIIREMRGKYETN